MREQASRNTPSLRALPVVLSPQGQAVHLDQPPAQTGTETPPWPEPYVQFHRRFAHGGDVLLFVPEVPDRHLGKLAQPFFAPKIKTALLRTA
jgi:hypothetical protein